MKVLAINIGSTSFKYKLIEIENERTISEGAVDRIGDVESTLRIKKSDGTRVEKKLKCPVQSDAIQTVFAEEAEIREADAVGFKTVHAGEMYGPVIIDDSVLEEMEKYCSAAPAHNPHYISAVGECKKILPRIPMVAVFETGFHRSVPDYAYLYCVPYEWYEKYGVRRYGFHGASLGYVTERLSKLVQDEKKNRFVICHLGGSSSICAVKDGISVDTSMGFTPQAGIPMNNRIGDIDPFLIPFIMDMLGKTATEVFDSLSSESGLLGISGVSKDVRDLEEAAKNGNERAELALNVFSYAVQKYIGSYFVTLGGLDVLAFSGGIGEHSSAMRKRICGKLQALGVELDEQENRKADGPELRISADRSKVEVFVVPTNEELIVAKSAARLLADGPT
jgi:acetate kinase